MTVTVYELLLHIINRDQVGEPPKLTDLDRSIIYDHINNRGESPLRRTSKALVAKLGALTWQDRDIGFMEWKAVADVLAQKVES